MKNLKDISKQLITLSLAWLVSLSLIVMPHATTAQTETEKSKDFKSSQTSDTNLVPPSNDNFANAKPFSFSLFETGTTADATKESGEPNHAGNTGGRSVWFKYEAFGSFTEGTRLSMQSSLTHFDTLLAVYTGTSVNNLTLIAANDDYGSTPTPTRSAVSFAAVPGTTYYFAIDGYNAAFGNYFISLFRNESHDDVTNFTASSAPEVSVFRPSNGTWYVYGTEGSTIVNKWGTSGDIPVPGDYNGDKTTEFAVFRPSNGTWYIHFSFATPTRIFQFGLSGDIPVPGDYNANGYDDFAVFRPSNGVWYILDGKDGAFSAAHFGLNGDKPVPRDFDMDGKLDLTVFRPSNGTWYILNSRDNSVRIQQWGISEDKPVPGGYATTGRADIAVWRPSTGTRYIYTSHNNQFIIQTFGQNGDIPQPLDSYTFGIYRPSTGTWYRQTSGGQVSQFQWGSNGDIPTATAYPIQ